EGVNGGSEGGPRRGRAERLFGGSAKQKAPALLDPWPARAAPARLSAIRQSAAENGGKTRATHPPEAHVKEIRNRLLGSLPASDLSLLRRPLRAIPIEPGPTPGYRGPSVEPVDFPET